MGWTVGEEAGVVGLRTLAPAAVGVVRGLLGQCRLVVVAEVDEPVVVALVRFGGHARQPTAALVASDGVNPDEPPPYPGPPPTQPPPPQWRPPVYVEPPAPRALAPQDLDAIEAREKEARTLTYGVGLVAAAVFLVVSCLLCSRVLL